MTAAILRRSAPALAGTHPRLRWCFFSPGWRSFDVLSGNTRDAGGAEAQVALLADGLAGLGHDVTLVYGDGQRQRGECVIGGVHCLDAAAAWRTPSSIVALWRTLRRTAPDVLYARLPSDFLWLLGLYARGHAGVRFIYAIAHEWHCRPGRAYTYNRWLHEPLYALGLMSADLVALQHEGQAAAAWPRLRRRTFQVPNLIRSTKPEGRAAHGQARYDAIWVGRIRPEKRLAILLDLADTVPHRQFAVVGGFDQETPPVQRKVLDERLRHSANVTYLGSRNAPEVIDLISRSRMLVNTSAAEGFPNTMLEAWSVGVPVLSLSIDPGGVIARERLGFVSGSIGALRHHLEALAGSESLARLCGDNGLAYVQRRHGLHAVHDALMEGLVPDGRSIRPR